MSKPGWETEMMRLLAEAVNNHATTPGTCSSCGLELRLHPPGRVLSNQPEFCESARTAENHT